MVWLGLCRVMFFLLIWFCLVLRGWLFMSVLGLGFLLLVVILFWFVLCCGGCRVLRTRGVFVFLFLLMVSTGIFGFRLGVRIGLLIALLVMFLMLLQLTALLFRCVRIERCWQRFLLSCRSFVKRCCPLCRLIGLKGVEQRVSVGVCLRMCVLFRSARPRCRVTQVGNRNLVPVFLTVLLCPGIGNGSLVGRTDRFVG